MTKEEHAKQRKPRGITINISICFIGYLLISIEGEASNKKNSVKRKIPISGFYFLFLFFFPVLKSRKGLRLMASKLKQPNKQPQGRVCWFSSVFSFFIHIYKYIHIYIYIFCRRQKLLIKQYTIRAARQQQSNRIDIFRCWLSPTAHSYILPQDFFLASVLAKMDFRHLRRDPLRSVSRVFGRGCVWAVGKCTGNWSLRFRPHIPPAEDFSLGVFTPESVVKFFHPLGQSAASVEVGFSGCALWISRVAPTPSTSALLYQLWY